MATYFISGANRGLGLQLATSLASRPSTEASRVFASGRKQSDELEKLIEGSNGRVQFVPLEVTSQQSAIDAARTVEKFLDGQGLDYLINNAGYGIPTLNGIVDSKDLSEHLNINLIGVNNVIAAFLPLVQEGNLKRVVNIGSTTASLTLASHFKSPASPSYKISKAALNMLTVQYAEAFRDEGITFVVVCPGWVKTDMGGKDYADLTPEEAITGLLEIADKIDIKDTGKFMTIRVPGWENNKDIVKRYDGSVRPW